MEDNKTAICRNCGEKMNSGDEFCMNCGGRVSVRSDETEKTPTDSAVDNRFDDEKNGFASGADGRSKKKPQNEKNATPKNGGAVAQKFYKYLKYVPLALFGLFVFLQYAFYAAPWVSYSHKYDSGGGVKTYSASYSLYGALNWELWVYMCFALAAVIYAIVVAVKTFGRDKYREVTAFGATMTLGECLSDIIGFVYFAYILLTAMSKSMHGEASGAGITRVTAFSIVFLILALGAIIARGILGCVYPELAKAEREKRLSHAPISAQDKVAAVHAQNTVAAVLSHSSATSLRSVRGSCAFAKVEEDFSTGKKPIIYYMRKNQRLSRFLLFSYFGLLGTTVAVVACCAMHLAGAATIVNPFVPTLVGSILTVTAAIVGYALPPSGAQVSRLRRKVRNHTESDSLNLPVKRLIPIWITLILLLIALVLFGMLFGVFMRGYIANFVFLFVASLYYIPVAVVYAHINAAMANRLWGWGRPARETPYLPDFDENREIALYEKYINLSYSARRNCKAARHYGTSRICSIAVLFVLSVSAVLPVSAVITDKFNSGYSNRAVVATRYAFGGGMIPAIRLPEMYKLRMLYGEYNKIEDADNGFNVYYYSDNYLDWLEENKDLTDKIKDGATDANILEQWKKAQAELVALDYDALCFYIYAPMPKEERGELGEYDYDARIAGISLIKNAGMTDGHVRMVREEDPFTGEKWYSDGSYVWAPATGGGK